MGSCAFLNKHKNDIEFLYSQANETSVKISDANSLVDSDLPDWLNEDYTIERKKEAIKVQMEKRKKELANRKSEFENIRKNKGFTKNVGQVIYGQKKENAKDDEEMMLLNYDSHDEESENIDEIFNFLGKEIKNCVVGIPGKGI